MSMAASPPFSEPFTGACVVMGVASCGKTTIGEAIAKRLGVPFIEGDRLHSAGSIAKMSAGIPLSDDDRWPWLGRIGSAMRGNRGIVAACSALKKSYRLAIADAAERPVIFVFLSGSRELLAARIAARRGHFMPPTLLDSQLATLEPPDASEAHVTLDLALPPGDLVDRAVAYLTGRTSSHG
jgi:carbohydrate kinase (thermoresistant glucokinase family)